MAINHKYSTVLLFLILFLFAGVMFVYSLTSDDLDDICNENENLLIRDGGTWECLSYNSIYNETDPLFISNVSLLAFKGNANTFSEVNTFNDMVYTYYLRGIADAMPENAYPFLLTYFTNDMAYGDKRGYIVNISSSCSFCGSSYPSYFFDGKALPVQWNPAPNYLEVTINFTGIDEFKYGSWVGFSMSDYFRPLAFTIEVYDDGVWETVTDSSTFVENWDFGTYAEFYSAGATGFKALRYNFTDFQHTNFRISELFVVNYASPLGTNVFLPKSGGTIYGDVVPYGNNSLDLGSSTKAFQDVYAVTYNDLTPGLNESRNTALNWIMDMSVEGSEINHTSLPIFARNKHIVVNLTLYDQELLPYYELFDVVVNERGTSLTEQLKEARDYIRYNRNINFNINDVNSWEVKYTRNIGNTLTVLLGGMQRAKDIIIEQNSRINDLEYENQQIKNELCIIDTRFTWC